MASTSYIPWVKAWTPKRKPVYGLDRAIELTDIEVPPPKDNLTRGERLYRELTNGQYECLVCTDHIQPETEMWSCKSCYHIYHFGCIDDWSKSKPISLWSCPTCKIEYFRPPQAKCWCRRKDHEDLNIIGNTCGQACHNIQYCNNPGFKCPSKCERPCHPGPCDSVTCTVSCLDTQVSMPKPVHVPGIVPSAGYSNMPIRDTQPPTRRIVVVRSTFSSRLRRLDPELWKPALGGCVITGLFVLTFSFWAAMHVRAWTRPIEHTCFTEYSAKLDTRFAFVAATLGIVPTIALPSFAGFISVYRIAVRLFNIHRRRQNPKFGVLRRFTIGFCLFLLSLICSSFFLITISVGPGVVWQNQMKNSCAGYDTRVELDISLRYKKWFPADKLTIFNPLNHTILGNTPEHLPYVPDPTKSFQQIGNLTIELNRNVGSDENSAFATFYRVQGNFSNQNLIADFDLRNNAWRLMILSREDTDPETHETTQEASQVKNGTWTAPTEWQRHISIPELDLQLPNMFYFLRKCNYQPFITGFRTHNMTAEEIEKQSGEDWKPESDANMVLRTASFGRSIQGLEVCAKREDYTVDGKQHKGLGRDFLVPLGLLAILRKQMVAEGTLIGECWFSTPL